jgi:selenocysteine lyase/cysteine desulfurase
MISAMNIEQLRAQTPGCKTKLHFNNAGASLMPQSVIDAMIQHIELEAAIGGYESSDLKAKDVEGFYESTARLVNSKASNIAFTSSATNSFARALSCIPFQEGDSILLANEDYISNQIAFLSLQKRFKIEILRAASLKEGGVDVEDMKRLMDVHHPKLVSLTHVPSNSGLIQPVEEVGQLCKERNIYYLVDACQSAGQLPLDVQKIHCDFLSATMRKFLRGPRGAGFLYVSDRIIQEKLEPLFIDMRGGDWVTADVYEVRMDARRFEDWELPYALVLGSKAAVDVANSLGLEAIQERNTYLCDLFRKGISAYPDLRLLDIGPNQSSIITIEIPRHNASEVLQGLRKQHINTSIANRHFALLDFEAKNIDWALRISPHYYNTEEEIELLIDALKKYQS